MAKPHLHILLLLLLLLSPILLSPSQFVVSFSFPSFDDPETGFGFVLQGGAEISNSTIRIARSGLAVYRSPIKFTGRHPGFSTYFSFSLSPVSGAGFGFFLTLSSVRMDLLDGPPPSVISVSFIASIHPKSSNSSGNHLQLQVGGMVPPTKSRDLSSKEFVFNSGEKLQSWIDYKGGGNANQIEVRLARPGSSKPERPLASYPMDLSDVLWRETMVVGFTSSTDNSTQNSTLYAWRFMACHGAPYLMHSEPLDPNNFLDRPNDNPSLHTRGRYHPWAGIVLALIFAAACGALVTFFALFVWFSVCSHRQVAPVEYPVHPTEVVYEKIVLVRVVKDVQKGDK